MSIDQAKRQRMLEFFAANWKKDRTIIVFAGHEEAGGLPTIHGMSLLSAAENVDSVIIHCGFGIFVAKSKTVGCGTFSFMGGGAMDLRWIIDSYGKESEDIDFSYCFLHAPEMIQWPGGCDTRNRHFVESACKKLFPAGWDYIKGEAKRKKALVAAAPKMLAALESFAASCVKFDGAVSAWSPESGVFEENFGNAKKLIHEAIQEARGGS